MTAYEDAIRPVYRPGHSVSTRNGAWWRHSWNLFCRISNVYFGLAAEWIKRPHKRTAFFSLFFLVAHGVFVACVKLPLIVAYWASYVVVASVLLVVTGLLALGRAVAYPCRVLARLRATL